MSDPTQPNPETPESQPPEDIAAEFANLGRNLKNILQSAWDSPERKKLQQEVEAGLADAARALNQTVTELKEGETGQQFKKEFEDLHTRIRSGEVTTRVRDDLLSALRTINSELEKTASHTSKDEGPPQES
jgi:hypothetical protein